jgi:voltage-gated potassium channel
MNSGSRLQRLILPILAIFLIGVFGYHLIEGWSLFDSLYMTVITLATIGYGETHVLSDAGRAFTIVLILAGLGVIGYSITELTAFLVEGEMRGLILRKRMDKKIAKLAQHYIVCGIGRTGRYVVEELAHTGRSLVVIDSDPAKIRQSIESEILAIQGDATEDALLIEAGIERAAGLVAALPSDRDNLFVVISARGLNPKLRIIAKVEEISSKAKFLRAGADSIVSANFIGGLRIASELIRPATVNFLDTMLRREDRLRVEDVPVAANSSAVDRSLAELEVGTATGALVLSLKRGDNFLFNPHGDTRIEPLDTLVLMGTPAQVAEAKRLFE